MRVIIRPTDLTSEKQKEKMSVPYSSIRSINKGHKDFDYLKDYSNKKLEKLVTQGLQDLQDYRKIPSVSCAIMNRHVDIKKTKLIFKKKLEYYKKMWEYKLACLPNTFIKRADDCQFPRSIEENPNHVFHIFNFELFKEDYSRTHIPIILDSSSAIAMGSSFQDTKHTRQVMQRFYFVRDQQRHNWLI